MKRIKLQEGRRRLQEGLRLPMLGREENKQLYNYVREKYGTAEIKVGSDVVLFAGEGYTGFHLNDVGYRKRRWCNIAMRTDEAEGPVLYFTKDIPMDQIDNFIKEVKDTEKVLTMVLNKMYEIYDEAGIRY